MNEPADPNSIVAEGLPFEGRHSPSEGDRMHFQSILIPSSLEFGSSVFIDDLGGALMSVQIFYDDHIYLTGTAFMVLPGLAITAAHVFEDFVDVLDKSAKIFLVGRNGLQLRPWAVAKIHYAQDVALIEIEPKFETGDNFKSTYLELTARLPSIGEQVLGLGIISEKTSYSGDEVLAVSQVASAGPVIDWLEKVGSGRGPTIICDFFGPHGMSGGPIFDKNGRVFGILSSAIGERAGEEFICFVPALWPAFMQNIHPQWPPGIYHESSLWPGHVGEADYLGIGNNESGERTIVYLNKD